MKGTPRLLERPQQELLTILRQLSVSARLFKDELVIEGDGWKKPKSTLEINREKSSQFATGVLFSTWKLSFPLEFQLFPAGMTDPYWSMSLDYAKQLGMNIQILGRDHFLIPEQQNAENMHLIVEPDQSSAFAIAAAAALCGEARLEKIMSTSLQPDFAFIEILKKMQIPVLWQQNSLVISLAKRMTAVDILMRDTPDLFPVLAVLCAFAEGQSKLFGAPRLVYKESDRIKKTAELLNLMGVENQILTDGIIIYGQGMSLSQKTFDFDPDHDHRMAMAAGLLLRAGWKIKIHNSHVVKKSFPEFWDILGIQP